MGHFADYASRELGVRVPEDYAGFMESHGKRLSEDPVRSKSWLEDWDPLILSLGPLSHFAPDIPFPQGKCGDRLRRHQDHHHQQGLRGNR